MHRRYNYITDEVLTTLDNAGDTQFSRELALMHKCKLTETQARRAIRYWIAARQVERLEDEVRG